MSNNKVILTADNDPELLHIMAVNLNHAGFGVIPMQTGAELLYYCKIQHPDLVVIGDILDMKVADVSRQIKNTPIQDMPVLVISGKPGDIPEGADGCITRPFEPRQLVTEVKKCLKRVERSRNRDPLTSLANQFQVATEMSEIIDTGRIFTAIFIDLDDLRAYNSRYGYVQGDRLIRLVGNIIYESVSLFGNPDDLVGHSGGDNFVVLTTPERAQVICRKIIVDFDNRRKTLNSAGETDADPNARDGTRQPENIFPDTSVHIAAVSNEYRTLRHYLTVTEIAAEQFKFLSHFHHSLSYYDLRQSGLLEGSHHLSQADEFISQEEMKIIQSALKEVVSLIKKSGNPLYLINDALRRFDTVRGKFPQESSEMLDTIRKNIKQLGIIIGELTQVVGSVEPKLGPLPREVRLKPWEEDSVRTEIDILSHSIDNVAQDVDDQLREISLRLTLPGGGQLTDSIESRLTIVSQRIQELCVFSNRCLLLADSLNERVEGEQARILQQELAQDNLVEALFAVGAVIARSMSAERIFDPEVAHMVSRHAVAIAQELGMSKQEQQALHFAALLQDFATASTLADNSVSIPANAGIAQLYFSPVLEVFHRVDFLTLALEIISARNRAPDSGPLDYNYAHARATLATDVLDVANAITLPKMKNQASETVVCFETEAARSLNPDILKAARRVLDRQEIPLSPGYISK